MSEISIELYPFEERVNVLTHFPGIIMGAAATIMLLLKPELSPIQILGYLVYGVSFVALFCASSVYHFARPENHKQFFKKVDHAAIYVFMGGCYTPFVLINMQGPFKYPFLALVWTIVCTGVLYKFKSKYKKRGMSLALYLFFGFMCFLVKADFLDQIPAESFRALALGGAFYVTGVFFYVVRRIPYHHGIWHLFVLAGAACHFYAIYHA